MVAAAVAVKDSVDPAGQVAAAVPATPVPAAAPKDTSRLYGQDIQLDFSNYVFAEPRPESLPKDSSMARLPRIAGNLTEDGKYRVNKYKLNFSPDIVYGNAGYDTFYGVTGSTIMAFSDMLGDHQIVFATNLLLDLKNSDYALDTTICRTGGLCRVRQVCRGAARDRERRVRREPVPVPHVRCERDVAVSLRPVPPAGDGAELVSTSRTRPGRLLRPVADARCGRAGVRYTHDTSLWGLLNPVAGTRYRFDLYGTPKLGADGLSFLNVTGDYRTYMRLGRGYSIALRLAGGGSFGKNPQKFIIGGVDNWINHTFEGGYIPLENAEDYIFLQAGLPLRGHNYNAAIGSKYTLFNFELRYPLFAFA